MSKYKGKHGGKKGQKIRAWVDPPHHSGNARKKTFFFIEVFPKSNVHANHNNHDYDDDHDDNDN